MPAERLKVAAGLPEAGAPRPAARALRSRRRAAFATGLPSDRGHGANKNERTHGACSAPHHRPTPTHNHPKPVLPLSEKDNGDRAAPLCPGQLRREGHNGASKNRAAGPHYTDIRPLGDSRQLPGPSHQKSRTTRHTFARVRTQQELPARVVGWSRSLEQLR